MKVTKKNLILMLLAFITITSCSCGDRSNHKVKEPLTDGDVSSARPETVKGTVKSKDAGQIEALIVVLDSKDINARRDAIKALKETGRPAVEPLIDAVANGSPVKQSIAAPLLDEIDIDWVDRESAQKTVPYFLQELISEDADVRKKAGQTLENIGEPAMEQLIAALRGDNSLIADFVGPILMRIDMYWVRSEPGRRSIPEFIAALKDERPGVRKNASKALINMGHEVIDSLLITLTDEDWDFQKRVSWILKKIDPEWPSTESAVRAVPYFIDALKSDKESVRFGAVIALGKIKDYRSVEPLIYALNDEFLYAGTKAEKVLKDLTGEDFGKDQTKWLTWWEKNKDTSPYKK
jgi:HEAT repeat protein